jgi:hypothetical protein
LVANFKLPEFTAIRDIMNPCMSSTSPAHGPEIDEGGEP